MTKEIQLNNKWLKASVLGCLWASSEIILGSFLHNLRIPFSSNFLTGIGIILLISVSYIWKEKGLIWRSGLVCALMKSISPSAIIFGPMIAIFCEAMLFELSVRIFNKNIFSYILGGMLAMSWNLFHKIINFIIIYGFNIVDLYVNLTKYAQKQFDIQFDNLWLPILYLLIIYLIFGLVFSIIGIYIGKKVIRQPLKIKSININKVQEIKSKKNTPSFNYSVYWLVFDLFGLISILCLINFTPLLYWSLSCITIILIWSFRYKSALRTLKKPKFWIFFVIITMLTSFLFSKFQSYQTDSYHGLLIGIEMNFRAAVMVVGFSVLGAELYNPKIRNFFIKTSFRQLPLALEVAFDTLPFVIANLPRLQEIFKKPVSIFQQLVLQADFWLDRVTLKLLNKSNVIIIKGTKGQGKTTLLNKIVNILEKNNIKTGGILSPYYFENNIHSGYDIVNVATKEKVVLSRIQGSAEMSKVGNYFFNEEGIEFGKKTLLADNLQQYQIIVIDEVGPWELENQGWAANINSIMKSFNKPMILVVRESLINKVIENWFFNNPLIIDASENNEEEIFNKILKFIKPKS